MDWGRPTPNLSEDEDLGKDWVRNAGYRFAGKPESSGRLSTLSQLSPIAVVNDLPGILNNHYYQYRSAYIMPSLRQHEDIVGFGEDGLILYSYRHSV
jgi:hypothetical protein